MFGGLAILGTEFGIKIDGAIINARDASPICAGLLFGAPAGIIAGIIGGVERWLAVIWGAGEYTQLQLFLQVRLPPLCESTCLTTKNQSGITALQ